MNEWISVDDKMPEIDFSKEKYDWRVNVLAATDYGKVIYVTYSSNGYAKTENGALPRFEWMGKICPFKITHWMPLPAAPEVKP